VYVAHWIIFEDFNWDSTCGVVKSPSAKLFYPEYSGKTCLQKAPSKFDPYDPEKYSTKEECCKEKFSDDVQKCCDAGEGECSLSGNLVYLPNWMESECSAKDENLLMDYEVAWSSKTVAECCKKRKLFISNSLVIA
jgi:hypothetical protein